MRNKIKTINKKNLTSILLIFSILVILGVSFFAGGMDNEKKETSSSKKSVSVTSLSSIADRKDDSGATNATGKAIETSTKEVDSQNMKQAKKKEKADEYFTDPVPKGKPKPVEPQDTKVEKKKVYHCTISISCDTILDHLDQLKKEKLDLLPKDGVICTPTSIAFYEGESVFDALLKVTKDQRVHMEYSATPIYNSNYIEGINNIYEFDCGELSGWMYKVNGWFPNYGCSRYQLSDGDVVEWVYTCDLGRDVGESQLQNGVKN